MRKKYKFKIGDLIRFTDDWKSTILVGRIFSRETTGINNYYVEKYPSIVLELAASPIMKCPDYLRSDKNK